METIGWAATSVGFVSGVTWIAIHTLDQFSRVCRKAKEAVRSARELRKEIRG